MDDPYDLRRFVAAQDSIYETALGELHAGLKRSHWMWFVFPQIAGLGSSPTARRYAIASLDEARAYLAHPLFGRRLLACTGAVNALNGRSAYAVFGTPDDLKFRSSVTLFQAAAPAEPAFTKALDHFFGGARDGSTVERLARAGIAAGRDRPRA